MTNKDFTIASFSPDLSQTRIGKEIYMELQEERKKNQALQEEIEKVLILYRSTLSQLGAFQDKYHLVQDRNKHLESTMNDLRKEYDKMRMEIDEMIAADKKGVFQKIKRGLGL